MSSSKLLEDFVKRRDESAFAELVRIYGPLVYGVCRRTVGSHHDAEDAFQATFLILAQKADSVRNSEVLPSWLYRVAYQVSLRARATMIRRRVKENPMPPDHESLSAEPSRWADLEPVLDLELNRLAEKYRAPIVLCDIGGSTLKDAAQELGWTQGTLATRLAKARSILAERLSRHGFALSTGALTVLIGQNAASAAVPASLVASTLQTATAVSAGQAASAGLVSSKIATLAQGTVKSMFLVNLKFAAAAFIGLAVTALGLQSQPGKNAAATELPADIRAALELNAKQLGPFSISYTRQLKSKISEQETIKQLRISVDPEYFYLFQKGSHRIIWQDPRFYASTEYIAPPPSIFAPKDGSEPVATQHEWSFDGMNQYRGTRYAGHKPPAYLHKKSAARGRIGELPQYVMSRSYFNGFSGLTFRQNGKELTDLDSQSDILNLLQNGGKLVSVENVLLDEHPCVKIDVIIENAARRRADAEDLATISSGTKIRKDEDGKEDKLVSDLTAEEQKVVAENIAGQRKLPETKRSVYYLDPALNYAMRRREEWYDPDQLLVRCDCRNFEKLADRPVWLPRQCESEFHEFERFFQFHMNGRGHRLQYNTTLSFFFADSFLTEILDVSEMSGLPVPDEKFALNYTEPGATIHDETHPVSAKNPSGRVHYTVGNTPQDTQRNQEVAAMEERANVIEENAIKPRSTIHWLLIANGIVVLLIAGFLAWRRFGR